MLSTILQIEKPWGAEKALYFSHIQDIPELDSDGGCSAPQRALRQSEGSDNAWHAEQSTCFIWALLFVQAKPFLQ